VSHRLVLPEANPPCYCSRDGLPLQRGEFHPLRPELYDVLTGEETEPEILPDLHCPQGTSHDRWRLLAGGMWYKFL